VPQPLVIARENVSSGAVKISDLPARVIDSIRAANEFDREIYEPENGIGIICTADSR
jgi:hypothetical protein